jgi:hypothetical protein
VRKVIKLNGGNDSRRPDIGDDKIDVFLGDAVCATALPIAFRASDEVRKANLAGHLIVVGDHGHEDAKKCGLIPRQQKASWSKNRL